MNKTATIMALALTAPLPIFSQTANDTIALKEVVVKASRVVRRTDGQTVFPSKAQKTASHSGVSLLGKLALPDIRVNETAHTVASISNRGEVQVRINGIVASGNDLMALDAATVTQVDFIDNPGVRYGQGVAYVIDIRTRRADSGYTAGFEATNSVTTLLGSNSLFASVNRGKSQWSMSYGNIYQDNKGTTMNETADYLLADGQTHSIGRKMNGYRSRAFNNSAELKYNLADSAGYVFQAALSADFNNRPRNSYTKRITETGKMPYDAAASDRSYACNPTLDLYFFRQIGRHQSVTANAVGTYISTTAYSFYDEEMPYSYDTDGKTYSLIGEAVYENRLKPFTVSAGVNAKTKYTDNVYSGDANSTNAIHSSDIYAFAQLKGSVGRLAYMAGAGVNALHYRQGTSRYNYWLWRPKVQVSCPVAGGVQASYSFEVTQHVSQIAMVSDTRLRQNSMEWTVGNPRLLPSRRMEHVLQVGYAKPRISAQIMAMYRVNANANMGKYVRTADNQFLYSQTNQPHCNMLYINAYSSADILPEHLSLALSGTVARFFNKGDDYNHLYTGCGFSTSLNGYWGRWTVQVAADSGWKFMEGEMKGFSAGYVVCSVSYRTGNWNIGAYVQNPFQGNPLANRSTTLNRFVGKCVEQRSKADGNAVSLRVSWRFGGGRKYNAVEKRISNKDSDTGILKSY